MPNNCLRCQLFLLQTPFPLPSSPLCTFTNWHN
jgi:hypothetical protein